VATDTKNSVQKHFFRYRAEDFPFYLLSLLLIGALIAPILEYPALRIALAVTLVYLASTFVRKHGAKIEMHALRTLVSGVIQYPVSLARGWWLVRNRVIHVVAIFAAALIVEQLLSSTLASTFWLDPLPWTWIVWSPFLIITAFRFLILLSHWKRAQHVRAVLESSPIRGTIAGISINNHIFHAFVTGVLSHLCLIAPCALFFALTEPTYLREALLIALTLVWFRIPALTKSPRLLRSQSVLAHQKAYFDLFYHSHDIAHRSRFYFGVFHGHHHDAIPTSLIGCAGGTGFLESSDRSLTWLDPLSSVVLTQFNWAVSIVLDMLAHQYIPGVFPFSKTIVAGSMHHAAHHFGSLHPLGMFTQRYKDPNDVRSGYDSRNFRIQWYLDTVALHEPLDDAYRSRFLDLNCTAGAASSESTADGEIIRN
jgi:hypothetical protein